MTATIISGLAAGVAGYLCRHPNYAVRLLMLRTGSLVIALTAMVAALSTTVQAADETLTLACQGTVTDTTTLLYGKPEPISVGIIINFTAKTVQGLNFMTRSIQGLVGPKDFVKITSISDQTVAFLGSSSGLSINGSIDRVTGDLEATYISTSVTQTLALKCRPAQRMF